MAGKSVAMLRYLPDEFQIHEQRDVPIQRRLLSIPAILQFLSEAPIGDLGIKENAADIASRMRLIIKQFECMIDLEFKGVFLQMEHIFKARNPDDINVFEMVLALSNASAALASTRDNLIIIQGNIHSAIEVCRKHIMEKKFDVAKCKVEIQAMDEEISILLDQILDYIIRGLDCELSAMRQEWQASLDNDAANQHITVGASGIAVAAVGILMAPFTCGVSLAATASSGAVAGMSIARAVSLKDEAKMGKRQSSENKTRARDIQLMVDKKIKEVEEKRRYIEKALAIIENLQKQEDFLQTTTSCCFKFIQDMNTILDAFQDAENTLNGVKMHSDSFTVTQNAFNRNPVKASSFAECNLQRLKVKWAEMMLILSSRGVKPMVSEK